MRRRLILPAAILAACLFSVPAYADCPPGEPDCPLDPPQSEEVNPDPGESRSWVAGDVGQPGSAAPVLVAMPLPRVVPVRAVQGARPPAPVVSLPVPMRYQDPADAGDVSCGLQALGMALDGLGGAAPTSASMSDLLSRAGMLYEYGTGVEELAFAAQSFGYAGSLPFHGATLDDLRAQLDLGRPVVVALGTGGEGQPGHFVTLTGISADGGWVTLNDPARGPQTIPIDEFQALWASQGNSGVVVAREPPLAPDGRPIDAMPWVALMSGVMALVSTTPWGSMRRGVGGRADSGGGGGGKKAAPAPKPAPKAAPKPAPKPAPAPAYKPNPAPKPAPAPAPRARFDDEPAPPIPPRFDTEPDPPPPVTATPTTTPTPAVTGTTIPTPVATGTMSPSPVATATPGPACRADTSTPTPTSAPRVRFDEEPTPPPKPGLTASGTPTPTALRAGQFVPLPVSTPPAPSAELPRPSFRPTTDGADPALPTLPADIKQFLLTASLTEGSTSSPFIDLGVVEVGEHRSWHAGVPGNPVARISPERFSIQFMGASLQGTWEGESVQVGLRTPKESYALGDSGAVVEVGQSASLGIEWDGWNTTTRATYNPIDFTIRGGSSYGAGKYGVYVEEQPIQVAVAFETARLIIGAVVLLPSILPSLETLMRDRLISDPAFGG